MDPILKARSVLDEKNWVFFKLYKDPSSPTDWKDNLDWYHQPLEVIVRPIVLNMPHIRVVFFGLYGPTTYSTESEKYVRKRVLTNSNLVYIRLRLSVKIGSKKIVMSAVGTSISANRHIVWDHEIMRTYHVRNDLGNRYGSNFDPQTLQFIRYWDSACRYILSVVRLPHNWQADVDVWGVPHLVNNSLGAYIRLSQYTQNPIACSNCGVLLYLETGSNQVRFSNPQIALNTPLFVARCPNCNSVSTVSSNI